MTHSAPQCLILACGNTLRSDDGIGPWLAQWAEEKFQNDPHIRVISRQQWTPDLAEDIAQSESVLFIDCSIESEPGSVSLCEVYPAEPAAGLATHHLGASELLTLSHQLFNALPKNSELLTIGAGSIELGERFSKRVHDAIPNACAMLEETLVRLSR